MTRILVWLASRRNPSPTQRQKHQPRFHQIGHLRLGKGFYHGHCHPGLRRPRWEEEPGLELELLRHTHTSDDNPFLCRNKYQPTTHTRLQYNSVRRGCYRHQTEHTTPHSGGHPSREEQTASGHRALIRKRAIVSRRRTFLEETLHKQTFYYKFFNHRQPTHTKRPAWQTDGILSQHGTDGRTELKGVWDSTVPTPEQLRRASRKGLGISPLSLRTLI